jgi:hypothetical protein
MRWYVLRTLLHKELLRLLNNRGGIAMALVLVVAAVLASAFGDVTLTTFAGPSGGLDGETACVVDHWDDDAWVAHLRSHVPPHLAGRVHFRKQAPSDDKITYPAATVGIQIRPVSDGASYKVWIWYPDADGAAAARFESWFWEQTRRHFEQRVGLEQRREPSAATEGVPAGNDEAAFYDDVQRRFRDRLRIRLEGAGRPEALAAVPSIDVARSRLIQSGQLFVRAAVAMFLVLMALCFVCIFLMPSATAEERERGTLLAQALSPASSLEILGAKLLFYPTLAVGLASLVTGICQPHALALPFFWLALGITALGTVGIGLTLSVLARTQRAASMGALSYMLAVGLLLLICRQNDLRFPAALMIESHGPSMLLAALTDAVRPAHWAELAVSWVLAVVWCGLATALFRRFGWQ